MIRRNVAIGVAAAFGGVFLSLSARAEPPRAALIVGGANYASLPAVVGCGSSANAVSAALRALNFQITDRPDASTGGIDAGMSEFARRALPTERAQGSSIFAAMPLISIIGLFCCRLRPGSGGRPT